MVRGLLAQRGSPGEGIWIDQICVDQSNECEKMLAIGAMDLVYRCARLVVVVIEDIMFFKEEKTVLERLIAKYEDDAGILPKGETEDLSQSGQDSESHWFERVWCSHELQLGTPDHLLSDQKCSLSQHRGKKSATVFAIRSETKGDLKCVARE